MAKHNSDCSAETRSIMAVHMCLVTIKTGGERDSPPPSPCAIACTDICAHAKDPAVHTRARCTKDPPKHPACSEGWVV